MSNLTKKHKDLMIQVLQETGLRTCMESSSSNSSDSEEENNELRRVQNYFEKTVQSYTDVEFKSNFRLERSSFNSLMSFLEPLMNEPNPKHTGGKLPIVHKKKVLMTIHYLANQDCFRQVANLFNVSNGTAHAVITYVIDLLYIHSPKFIKWPSREQAIINENLFYNKGGLRNVLGCIDGSHITIPNVESNNDYINRKGYSSILLQGVVNFNMEFIDIYCGEPGSMHDSRLLRKSGLYHTIQEDPSCMYGFFLLGDSAYMCQNWLVPPFKDNGHLTRQEHRFNSIHSSLRARVENAFGMLKGRFRGLREFQNINRSFIIKATVAAIVLHNICLSANDEVEIINENINQAQFFEPEDISAVPRSSRRQQAFLQLVENRTLDTI